MKIGSREEQLTEEEGCWVAGQVLSEDAWAGNVWRMIQVDRSPNELVIITE